jgi:DNA-binding MarR family transcriptional regulator
MSKPETRRKLIERVMMSGRQSGTRAILFQQAVAHLLGVNASDMKCLDLIALNGHTTPSQLVDLTGLTSGAVTGLVDRLEKAKLIRRQAYPDDRRKTLLVPTSKAKEKVGPLYGAMGRAMGELFSGYSDEELEFLGRHTEKVSVVFREQMAGLKRGRVKT